MPARFSHREPTPQPPLGLLVGGSRDVVGLIFERLSYTNYYTNAGSILVYCGVLVGSNRRRIGLLIEVAGTPEYPIHCPSLTLDQLVKVRILLRQPHKAPQIAGFSLSANITNPRRTPVNPHRVVVGVVVKTMGHWRH